MFGIDMKMVSRKNISQLGQIDLAVLEQQYHQGRASGASFRHPKWESGRSQDPSTEHRRFLL